MADIEDALDLDNIQESTILAMYDDIMDLQILTRDILEFVILRLMMICSGGIGHIVDDDWHLNILLILPISSTFPHSSSVLHDMMISIIHFSY
jgi:hypothetical protein